MVTFTPCLQDTTQQSAHWWAALETDARQQRNRVPHRCPKVRPFYINSMPCGYGPCEQRGDRTARCSGRGKGNVQKSKHIENLWARPVKHAIAWPELLVGCYYASEGLVQREFLALTGGEPTKIPAVDPAIVHPVGVCMNQTFAAHRTGVADFYNLRFGGAPRTGEEIGEAHPCTRRLGEPVKVSRVIHQSTKPGVGGGPGCVYNGGF